MQSSQISEYFNHFYQTVLRQHIHDAIVHSQWLYFLSMFKNGPLDKERIELYLGILSNQKGKKSDNKNKDKSIQGNSADTIKLKAESKVKIMDSGENHINFSQIKLEKRLSENWKPTSVVNASKTMKDVKLTDPFLLKRTTSTEDEPNRSLRSVQDESKAIRQKNEPIYALPSCTPNSYAYLRPKSSLEMATERQAKLKERHGKLMGISKRLVTIFEAAKLRG